MSTPPEPPPEPFAAPSFGPPPPWGAPPSPPPPTEGDAQPAYAQPAYGHPAYGHPAYGQPAPTPPGYPGPGYGFAPPRAPGTNGMAIASLVLGILWLWWVGSILALVFGYVARGQIRQSGQQGAGLALAGIILGWIGVGFLVPVVLLVVVAGTSGSAGY